MAACTVYQDATNTYAKNNAGTVISQVTRASLTDHIPINAAIAAGTGVNFVGTGSYTVNATIVIQGKSGFVLDFNNSIINGGAQISNSPFLVKPMHGCSIIISLEFTVVQTLR